MFFDRRERYMPTINKFEDLMNLLKNVLKPLPEDIEKSYRASIR